MESGKLTFTIIAPAHVAIKNIELRVVRSGASFSSATEALSTGRVGCEPDMVVSYDQLGKAANPNREDRHVISTPSCPLYTTFRTEDMEANSRNNSEPAVFDRHLLPFDRNCSVLIDFVI